MSNVAIDLTKTVKEIITTMKTAIDNLNSDVATNKTAIDNLNTNVATNKTAIDNLKGQILEAVYPVGSVYVSITDSRNPNAILGFGTWEALPAGYGLVAQGTATAEDGSTLTFTAGEKSGEFKHQLTVGELATHNHRSYANCVIWADKKYWDSSISTSQIALDGSSTDSGAVFMDRTVKSAGLWYSESTGSNKHHNNVSPCIGAYLWHRTA